jgi:hypothetical protein
MRFWRGTAGVIEKGRGRNGAGHSLGLASRGRSCLPVLLLVLLVSLCAVDLAGADDSAAPAPARPADQTPPPDKDEYHTPLAGRPYRTNLWGHDIDIPARNRDNTLALTLGATLFSPQLADSNGLPLAALYWTHRWDESRVRAIISVFVNEVDVARDFGKFELLGHLDNDTVPFAAAEIVDGQEFKPSSIESGNVSAWLGAGYRRPVHPWQADNDLRVQLFAQGGYLYSKRTADTGSTVRLPPNTPTYGVRLRTRYDSFRRNLMELPQEGWAGGFDLEYNRRDLWSDANYGGDDFDKTETQDYAKFSGYLMGATGIPGLSERNRVLGTFYGGTALYRTLDRFSAFRVGGGPFANESDDLFRISYPGAMFNQFPVSDYFIGTLEYRRELLFFLYLHLRATLAWVDRTILTSSRINFSENVGKAVSVGLTSGFIWDSQLYLEYSRDTEILRNGRSGNGILVLWSKSF